jgi:5'(3')-deoxyribonucleotidase
MSARPRAGIDLDGVLHEWSPTARQILFDKLGLVISESQTYNWIKDECARLGKPEAWGWLWREAVPAMFSGEPYPGAIDAIHRLQQTHDIVIVTKRPRGAIIPTFRWLALHGIEAVEVIVLTDPTARKSVVECDWYVDDSPEVIEELWRAGKRVYAFDQPWNRNLPPEVEGGVTRVKDWDVLLRKVLC